MGTGNKSIKSSRNKKRDLTQLLLSIGIVLLINFIGSFWFFRLDLTSEKRFTLAPATKQLVENIDDVVYVKVYLEGEFPAGFKRLRDATKELLDEFRAISGEENIEYEFINPNATTDTKERENIYKQLYNKGLMPTSLEVKDENGVNKQVIFPGALVTYKGRTTPIQLLKNQTGLPSDEVLNNSVQNLEYEFSNALRKLKLILKPRIAFIEGHHELDTLGTYDLSESLKEYYEVQRISINGNLKALDGVKAIIIAKPDSVFSEKDKFIIDQFIMHGGKVLWAIDPVYVSTDSLRVAAFTLGIANSINLDDQLFKYGVRINYNLVLDMQCSPIPVNKSFYGQQPKFELEPWLFYPLANPSNNSLISKNLDLIRMPFASSIDTVGNSDIKKTILLTTSRYSKALTSPVRIDLRMISIRPDERQFNKPFLPLAVLLEGEFTSLYKNRPITQLSQAEEANFKKEVNYQEKSKPTAMIVISDGDITRNELNRGRIMELGYDIYTQQTFANKNFLLNCMNYLCDDSGLLSVRAREVKLRLLDKKKVAAQKTKWQMINTVVPVLLVLIYGFAQNWYRKRKYT